MKIFNDEYNQKEIMKYALWKEEDVHEVVASLEGENDEEEWITIVILTNSKYGYLEAGCDYTGWG